MKNNIEPMIQSMIKINNSMKRTECDDEFFFEDGFFKIAELFSSDFIFLEVVVDGVIISSSSSSFVVVISDDTFVVHVLFIIDVDFEVSVVVVVNVVLVVL